MELEVEQELPMLPFYLCSRTALRHWGGTLLLLNQFLLLPRHRSCRETPMHVYEGKQLTKQIQLCQKPALAAGVGREPYV